LLLVYLDPELTGKDSLAVIRADDKTNQLDGQSFL